MMSLKVLTKTACLALSMVSVLTLSACGKANDEKVTETTSPPPVASPAPAPDNVATATATPTNTATATTGNGEKVYQASCRVCHDTGNLGSPRMGDKAAWQARIAQGKDTLYAHAINGFTGKTGTMPPKGTSTAPDADIKSAVDYIVAHSQ